MEQHSLSSLTFKGSIPEAILEAKNQKKLFVVYISGEDGDESASLKESTWADSKVAESISKYCVLLNILEGSSDASQFSALYPQNSVPSITAIGYNGVKLWQHDGFVSAEVLASTLEKTWLSIHIQETTATFLTAAIASKNPELSASGGSSVPSSDHQSSSSINSIVSAVSSDQGSSSSIEVPSAAAENHIESSNDSTLSCASIAIDKDHDFSAKKSSEGETFVDSSNAGVSGGGVNKQSSKFTGSQNEPLLPVTEDSNTCQEYMKSKTEGGRPSPEIKTCKQTSRSGNSNDAVVEKTEGALDKDQAVEDKKHHAPDSSTVVCNSNDIHLSIRLPNGVGLQEKFSMTSALKMVKEYVDANKASGNGAYDLAIPYPRRVFSDQDFSKSLSELGLLNRQSLIVVPHRSTHAHTGPQPSNLTDSSSDDDNDEDDEMESGGYFAYVKKFISILNPFSHVSDDATSSNSENESDSSTWQYSPNAEPRYNSSSTGRPDSIYMQNPTTGERRNVGLSGMPTARFGSNIHTLRHDEDDGRFGDRNTFWNGNSTQFGGDSDQR